MLLHWIQLCFLSTLSKSIFSELLVLIPLVLYLIRSVPPEISLNWISRIRFRCSFFRPWENQYMVHGFNSISIVQFSAMICSVSVESSLIVLFTRLRCFSFWFWVNYFCLFCVHLMLVYRSVQLSHTLSDFSRLFRVWYRKLEYCVTSFWFHYHRLWWSSWHAMLALILLYVFLVWIFNWHDLFQVTGTEASCVPNFFSVHNLWANMEI